jgi:hypothetical protein
MTCKPVSCLESVKEPIRFYLPSDKYEKHEICEKCEFYEKRESLRGLRGKVSGKVSVFPDNVEAVND